MNEMTMGQRIAEQRKKLGISQEALGEKTGVSRQAISKWEADGAVPEIDKLIALSKLFGVSVGWLLGVEEQAPQNPDQLSDEQLKMIEEIVKRYRPEPMEKKFPWIIAIGLFAAALAIVVSMFFTIGSGSRDYSRQISALDSNYQSIQSQLSELSGRVEDIAAVAEGTEKLLHNYEFSLVSISSAEDTAVLSLYAVPKKWLEGCTGMLSVTRDGVQTVQEVCEWNGTGCTAQVTLPIADDYEYCFILHYGDGTQEMQVLEGYDYSDLETNTSLRCTAPFSVAASYSFGGWTLELDDCYLRAFKPVLGIVADAKWSEVGVILYQNGEELDRRSTSIEYSHEVNDVLLDYASNTFRDVKLEEGDELELRFFAQLDNGMYDEATAARWTVQDGKFVKLEIAE